MMGWNTFGRSLVFAVLAAAGWLPWTIVTIPVLGGWASQVLYVIGLTAAYVAGLTERRSFGFVAGILAGAVACGFALVVPNGAVLAVLLAILLGVARSGFFYRTTPARALTIEVGLLGAGLLFARFLAGPMPFSVALAVWGFFLVQSLFFLIGGARAGIRPGSHPDPFEDVYARAVALLERDWALR